MQKLLIANWKENPKTEKEAGAFFRAAARLMTPKNVRVVICPPLVYLEKLADALRRSQIKNYLALGAQDVFWETGGAYTGETSPQMLENIGIRYVIVGHSERRQWLHETDAMINKKIRAALGAKLRVVLCVGEPASIRKKGIVAAQKFVAYQLIKDLRGIARIAVHDRLIVAYEPIWAISTSKNAGNASPEDARAMAIFIKKRLSLFLKPQVLYGGSVNSKNIRDYIQYKEVDGALVGGASLKTNEWKKIVAEVSKTAI